MKISLESVYNWYRNTIRNPQYRWWLILGTLAYLLVPFDIAPDFFPIVGQVDDLVVVTLLLTELCQLGIEGFKTKRQEPTVSNPEGETVDVKAVSLD